MIKLVNLTKSYHDGARDLIILDNINFCFPQKGTVAILGKSGVGKSTLLHLLAGLDKPNYGDILYGSELISNYSKEDLAIFRRKNIGFVFQSHQLLAEFTAEENVEIPLVLSGISEKIAKQKARELLAGLSLQNMFTRYPGQLSGGEQQRVSIARAIITNPKVILADEPTGNLDSKTGYQVQNILIEIQKGLDNLLIVVTHNIDFAKSLNYCFEMEAGGVLKQYK